ncbi:MAG TPA: glycosyltransferase family 4 protein [Phycisphaerae bacterium]|nr:glycosyltransferase family 4 protein [Phycisphaerae bacterium]
MRIAFLTSQFPGIRMGGIGSNTLAIARGLADIGHDIHLFTFHLPPDLLATLPANITFHPIPDLAQRTADNAVPPELAAAAQSAGPSLHFLIQGALLADALLAAHAHAPFDIVEAPDYEALILPLIWRLATATIPNPPATITHIHSGSAINRRGNNLPTTPDDLAIDALEQAAIMSATAACSTTAAVARESRISFPLDRPIETTHLGIPQTPAADITPPPADGPVLFVGRLESLKGVDTLTYAANIFLTECPNATLEFVGPDTNTAPSTNDGGAASMRQWIERTLHPALLPRVRFTGELPPPAVADRIRAARLLCLPSKFENFSNVAAQALSLGRTAIVSAATGLEEVMGDAGITFEKANPAALANALTALWNNPQKIATLSIAAHTRAHTLFHPAAIAHQRTTFYQKARTSPAIGNGQSEIGNPLLHPLLLLTHTLLNIPLAAAPLTPGTRLANLLHAISPDKPLDVALYGAGRHSAKLLAEKHRWESKGHRVTALIDDHPRFAHGGTHLNLPVLSPSAALQQSHPLPIVLSSDTFEEQLWQKTAPFREKGIPTHRLYA